MRSGTAVNAGDYTANAVALAGAKAANYKLPAEKAQAYTIAKADIAITGAVVAEKVYNGVTDDAKITAVTFSGLQNGEALVLGTDFAVTGMYADENAGDAVGVTVTVEMKDTVKANNYKLDTATFETTGKVTKAVTTLTIQAGDAVYTGKNYAEANITKTSNVNRQVNYTYFSDEDCTISATPINVGTYYAKGQIVATTNASAAEATASFQITKAPLTVKANDKTGEQAITYGDAPANAGVTYTGFVNGEGASVLTGELKYTYNYEHNGDEVAVTVVGGDKINVGKYSAAASALTGAKAGNYKIKDASKTQAYEIVPALTSTTVSVDTVTATIDGLTIKLVGYCSDKSALKVNDTLVSAGKLIVNDVEYIIDASDVIELPAEVVIAPAEPVVPDAPSESAAAAGVTQAVIDALKQGDTKVENLETAVPELIEQLRKEDGPEGTDKIEVEFFLAIEPIEYQAPEAGTHGRLKLDIEPDRAYYFAKHKLYNGLYEYLDVVIRMEGSVAVATWQQSSFSEVELVVAYTSQQTAAVDLCAPGHGVLAYSLSDVRVILKGTSFATPCVSAVLALLLESEPNMSPAFAANLLCRNAEDLGAAGRDDAYGHGFVNVSQLLARTSWAVEKESADSFRFWVPDPQKRRICLAAYDADGKMKAVCHTELELHQSMTCISAASIENAKCVKAFILTENWSPIRCLDLTNLISE